MKRTPTTRAEAIAILEKRKKSIECPLEKRLQYECVNAFDEKCPEKQGRLFATFQNPKKDQVNIWISLGLVPGVSDLIYIDPEFHIIGLELKQPGKVHKMDHLRRQLDWMRQNCYRYAFVCSVSEFWDMIENRNNEIFRKRIENLENNSTKSYTF
jgi:hypothetical protein